MSTHLEWIPENKRGKILDIDRGLKFALQEEYGYPVRVTLGVCDIGFLRGLKAAKVKGAEVLIDAIEKYEAVKVWETE